MRALRWIVSLALAWPGATAAAREAKPDGTFAQVDETRGIARYSIPIEVPPGAAGHTPRLSLEYASPPPPGAAGPLGVGWRLGGLSRIERDLRFGPYDLESGACAPAYCYRRAFLLDGRELVCDAEPCDGRYRTQVDDGRWIRFHGETAGWEIRDREGRRLVYGARPGARVGAESTRNGQVFAWLLERVEDAHGNWIELRYGSDGVGVRYPESVTWAQSGAPANRRVRFELEPRPDAAVRYSAGFREELDRRVVAVAVEAGATRWQPVARYELGYAQSPDSGRSLLVSVTRSGSVDGRTVALRPWRFRYSEGDHRFGALQTFAWMGVPIHGQGVGLARAPVELDGDALVDYLFVGGEGPANPLFPDTASYAVRNLGRPHDFGGELPFPTYFDDIPWDGATFAPRRLADEALYASRVLPFDAGLAGGYAVQVEGILDLDGDRYPDHVTGLACTWQVRLGGPDGPGSEALPWTGAEPFASWPGPISTCGIAVAFVPAGQPGTPRVGLLDLTGDGRPDRVVTSPRWRVGVNRGREPGGGGGFLAPLEWAEPFGAALEERWGNFDLRSRSALVHDLNADGLPDRLHWDRDAQSWWIAYNYGYGFDAAEPLAPGRGELRRDGDSLATLDVDLADLNGDGYPDQVDSSGEGLRVWLGTGRGFRDVPVAWGGVQWTCDVRQPVDGRGADLADYDGDGLLDRSCHAFPDLFDSFVGTFARVTLNAGPLPDLLVAATSPLGGEVGFAYKHAAGEPGEPAAPANAALPGPLWVVARLVRADGRPDTPDVVDEWVYADAAYDRGERELRGFGRVTRRRLRADGDLDGERISRYRTDRSCTGALQERETRDAGGALLASERHDYLVVSGPPGAAPARRWAACLPRESTYLAVEGGAGPPRASRVVRDYGEPVDPFHNLRALREYGEWDLTTDVDVPGDERVTYYAYATPAEPARWLVSLPSEIRVQEVSGALVSHTRFLYDGARDPAAPSATRGLRTAVEGWLESPLPDAPPGRWVRRATYRYDRYGNRTASLGPATPGDPDGLLRTVAYDPVYATFPVARTDGADTATPLTTRRAYDGCVEGERAPPGLGLPCVVTTPQGGVTRYGYDPLGRRITREDPAGLRETTRREAPDPNGPAESLLLRTLTLPDPAQPPLVWRSWLDGLGRPFREEGPGTASQRIVSERSYDARGRVASASLPHLSGDAAAPRRRFEYDALDRPTRIEDYDGVAALHLHYRPWEGVEEVNLGTARPGSPAERTERRTDGLGRMVAVSRFADPVALDPPLEVRIAYDAGDRPRRVLDPLAVDPGRCAEDPECTPGQSHVTELLHDSLGRTVEIVDPDSGRWRYAWDDADRLEVQRDANGHALLLAWDPLGRLRARGVSPEGLGVADAAFRYGEIPGTPDYGRLVAVDSETAYAYAYDGAGRRVEVTQRTAGLTFASRWEYDALGRVRTRHYPDGARAHYGWDGLRLVEIRASGWPLRQARYDALGRPIALALGVSGDGGPVVPLAYDYDGPGGRLSRIRAWRRDSTGPRIVLDLALELDALGRVTAQATGGAAPDVRRFEYDGLGRLVRAFGPWEGPSEPVWWTYRYDALGNLRALDSHSGAYGRRWSYADPTRPRFLTGFAERSGSGNGVIDALWPDAAGNPRTRIRSGRSETFVWNAEGRLFAISGRGLENHYDAFGRRVLRRVFDEGGIHDVVYVGDDFEYDVRSERVERFFFAGGQRIARWSGLCPRSLCFGDAVAAALARLAGGVGHPAAPLTALALMLGLAGVGALGRGHPAWLAGAGIAVLASGLLLLPFPAHGGGAEGSGALGGGPAPAAPADGVTFYVPDHLGSTRAVVDGSGALVATWDYDPFGATLARTGDSAVAHLFTSRLLEPDAGGPGIYDFGARLYDPLWGRFLSPDGRVEGLDAAGLHRYAYAANQPTSLIDRDGRQVGRPTWERLRFIQERIAVEESHDARLAAEEARLVERLATHKARVRRLAESGLLAGSYYQRAALLLATAVVGVKILEIENALARLRDEREGIRAYLEHLRRVELDLERDLGDEPPDGPPRVRRTPGPGGDDAIPEPRLPIDSAGAAATALGGLANALGALRF